MALFARGDGTVDHPGAAPAPVAAGDPASTPPTGADRQKLEQQVQSMREKIQQLEKEGKHDEAQKLYREARELMAKLRGPAAQPGAAGPEAEKIQAQLREMHEKIVKAEQEGKHDEAQRLKTEARALYSKLNPRAGASAGNVGPERQRLYEQMRALHEKIEKAKQEGKSEEVQRLMREAEELRAKLSPPGGNAYGGRQRPGGDREARLQHLRAAAENLKAAGCEPEAQHVMEMIQRMQAERGGEGSRPRAGGQPERGATVPPGASTANPGAYATASAIQELRSQMEEMRREMHQLREELNRAKGGQQR